MPVTFPLNDILTAQEQTMLRSLLEVRTAAELEAAVTRLSKAAMREFADMILNRYAVRATAEVNEIKLLHLVKHYFGGKIRANWRYPRSFAFRSGARRRLCAT
jgi:hypothetical protein